MGVSKTSEHMQIKMKMPNPSQKHPESAKAPNEDFKNMDILCTFKIKVESKIWVMGVSKTSDHIQIKIEIANPSQEPLASSKAPNQDLKDIFLLCTLKIKIEIQNLDVCIKDQ